MSRSHIIITLLCLAVAAGAGWYFFVKQEPASPADANKKIATNEAPENVGPSSDPTAPESEKEDPAKPSSGAGKPDPRFERLADGRSIVTESAKAAAAMHNPDTDPQTDLEALESMFSLYRWAYKYVPEGGDNRELVSALLGDNPKNLVFLPAKHAKLNADGELLDRWGTPYFFHKISDQVIDVISAGPDRRLWSSDDLGLGHTETYQSTAGS